MGHAALARAWIEKAALESILGAFTGAAGEEPCGVLLGVLDGGEVRIGEAPKAPNVHPHPAEAFRIAPLDLLAIVRDARQRGLTVVGFWHGHLRSAPVPGPADVEGLAQAEALGPSARLMIIAGRGAGRAPVLRAWSRGPGGLREVPLGL